MRVWIIVMVIVVSGPFKSFGQSAGQIKSKPRIIVLTDMTSVEAGVREPDDAQSMIRLMLYSDEFDIEGLIASSGLDGQHGQVVRSEYIMQIVDAYAHDRPNLILHDKEYPKPGKLLQVIKSGQPVAGKNVLVSKSIGKGLDTEASEWIIKMVDKPESRPLWITIWGGSADLAQALWKIREKRTPQELTKFIAKIRVIASGDQDSTGPWIKSNFPGLFYVSRGTGGRGIYRQGDTSLVRSAWVRQNIKGHGALGDLYPDYQGGDIWGRQLGKVYGIKEGDSPMFLGLITNGLNERNHLTWENWGGRIQKDSANPHHYFDAIDSVENYKTDVSPYLAAVYRWRTAFQADFQARLNWCIKPFNEANHAPKGGDDGIVNKTVKAGKKITLHSGKWSDPDGNNLTYHWLLLPEESSYRGELKHEDAELKSFFFVAPLVNKTETVHLLLTVSDNGTPSLCRYQRFNFIITPN